MNEEQIKVTIENFLAKVEGGLEIENPKVDFKRDWYNLNDEESRSEFLKDVSAIANTVGLDGFIIIGYDEKTKTYHNTTLKSSGKKNDTEILGILSKHIDGDLYINMYDVTIKKNKLSVIHVPPQFNKPFSVKNYRKNEKDNQHRIFVRKSSRTDFATKYDLDFMYYDRKNVLPEYAVDVSIQSAETRIDWMQQHIIFMSLAIENYGLRTIAIENIELEIARGKLIPINLNGNSNSYVVIKTNPIVIGRDSINTIPSLFGRFNYDDELFEETRHYIHKSDSLNLKLRSVKGHTFNLKCPKR